MKEYRVVIKSGKNDESLDKVFYKKREAMSFYEKITFNKGDVAYLFAMNPITILKARRETI